MQRSLIDTLLERLAREPAVLVSVDSTQGSAPREAGAWMVVFADGDTVGTIGGGHLEFEAVGVARRALAGAAVEALRRFALGPSLGQCCGGVVQLRFERIRFRLAGGDAWLELPASIRHRAAAPDGIFYGIHFETGGEPELLEHREEISNFVFSRQRAGA